MKTPVDSGLSVANLGPARSGRPLKGYFELLARSNFSFLQGASHPEEMTEQAVRHNYKGIAICDLNGLYGVVRAYQAAKSPSLFTASVEASPDFKVRVGSELTLTDGSSIAFLPLNREGYTNLCRLLTLGKRNVAKYFSEVSLPQVFEHAEGLLAFPLPPYTEERFLDLQKIFKDRLYLPVWRDLSWESLTYGQQAFELEAKHHAQLFVTQRPFMHSPERKRLFDVLTCIHHHTELDQAQNILAQNAERHLRPLGELAYLWQDRPDLVEVTCDIAARIDFDLSQIRYRYPSSRLPSGMTPSNYLKHLVKEAIPRRFPEGLPAKVQELIEYELQLIQDLEYEDYFLTLHEICQFAQSRNILYQGRGSAANSVVCFCLGLTAVNPIEVDLLFERFISRERKEPPDIDIDFEHDRREEVIQHIYELYNPQHAAMVCTVIRFKTRLALRETAKVLGIPLATINAMVKFMGRDGIKRLVEEEGLHKRFGIEDWKWTILIGISQEIYGFPRHIGIHTGGFLITQNPITDIVPVEKATMNGRYVIQWNKDDVNDLKLMKIDVLALGMLSALRRSLDLLREKKGLHWDLAQIPRNDPATYEMIGRADTVGVFQIESRAQMNSLPRLKPRNYYDLVVQVALIRPGPLQGGMVHPYVNRRNGMAKIEYPHEDLKPILAKTLGVPIFQEQVMKVAVVAANFTPGEADELRRIMSAAWRKRGTMDGLYKKLMQGMNENGIPEPMAQQIYRTIEGFASYGFPESHAASFALLTYASSYLKCHHPDVFFCSLLNSQPMGFYPPRVLVSEAQKQGVRFLPLDIQKSELDYSLENPQENGLYEMRVGLRSLSSIASEHLETILNERRRHGAYQSFRDFIQRTEIPRPILSKLAASGALDSFGREPRRLLWQIESLSLDPQSFLWGAAKESPEEDSTPLPFESRWEEMQRRYQSTGFSLDSHPMSILRTYLNERNEQLRREGYIPFSSSKDFDRLKHQDKVRVAGLVSITQRPPTAKGMCFITLEDEFGFMNVVITPDVYQKDRITIYSKRMLEIQGKLEKVGGVTNLMASRVFPLEGVTQPENPGRHHTGA